MAGSAALEEGVIAKLEKRGRIAFDTRRLKERRRRVEVARCLLGCGVVLRQAERELLAAAREDPEYFGFG